MKKLSQFSNRSIQKLLNAHVFHRRQSHPTPVLLPGKSHGRRSLVGCSLWGREESNTTEWLHFHFSLPFIGEGNGNPIQCSCQENPRDSRAYWAAVHGVAQSRTRLKWCSSSSSSSLIGRQQERQKRKKGRTGQQTKGILSTRNQGHLCKDHSQKDAKYLS